MSAAGAVLLVIVIMVVGIVVLLRRSGGGPQQRPSVLRLSSSNLRRASTLWADRSGEAALDKALDTMEGIEARDGGDASKACRSLLHRCNPYHWSASSARKFRNKAKILVAFCQLVSGLGFVLDLRFPSPCYEVMEALGFFNLQLFGFIPFNCVVDADYFLDLVFSTTVPIAISAGLFAGYKVYSAKSKSLANFLTSIFLLSKQTLLRRQQYR